MRDDPTPIQGGKSRWTQRGVWGAVCALVIGVYSFAAQSGSLESMSLNPADTYYNLLVQGFRAGHLSLIKEAPPGLAQLADPYDSKANTLYRPASNPMTDLSYYKGRLYLYFGVTPALILFWPYAALTGHYLFHRQAVLIFCSLGFLVSVGLLHALWRRYFTGVSVWVGAACALALGLATGLPVLLTRSEVYEVPVSCGYMLVMLALGAIWCALHEPAPQKSSRWFTTPTAWLAGASVAYGLAVGARPTLIFGAVILLVPVVLAWREHWPIGGLVAAATGPMLVIGLGLMLYNFLRFDDPFEFGLRYELGGARMDRQPWFSLPYLWLNIRLYFLEPARWSSRFPFVHPIVLPPLPLSRGGVQTAFGVLTNIPLVWLALAAPLFPPLRGRLSSVGFAPRGFMASVVVVFGTGALVLCLFRGANLRYEVEFLPALVLLAVAGILRLERALASRSFGAGRPVWRRAVRWAWGLLLSFSVAFNLLAGVENCARARCYLGNALWREGKMQEAMRHYEWALWIDPDSDEVHINLGAALSQVGRVQEAMRHYEWALRIKPDSAEAYNNLGGALAQAGRVQEAIGHYEQALRIKPDFAEAHNSLGGALQEAGRVQEAIRHYEQALQIRPDYAEVDNNLGVALAQVGKLREAIEHYEHALRIRPNFAEAHHDLGVALAQVDKLQEAIRHFEQALRIKPNFAEAHCSLGIALERAGRPQESLGHFEQALRIKPDFAEAQNGAARLRTLH